MITVSSSQTSAVSILARLKADKNKFTRPHFKRPPRSNQETDDTVQIMAEDYDGRKGRQVAEIVAKIKSDSKAWQRVVDSVQGLGQKGVTPKGGTGRNLTHMGMGFKSGAKKEMKKEELEEIMARAKEADELRQQRIEAATNIQKFVRQKLAEQKVQRIRVEKKAAILIQRFLLKLVRHRKHIEQGLERLRQHYYASIIQQFMRECVEKIASERDRQHKEDLIRALLDGIKARRIFQLPRMLEVKQEITGLLEQMDDPDLDPQAKYSLEDDLKYHRNLYLNFFEKLWSRKFSVVEELQREKEREQRKKAGPVQPSSPGQKLQRQSSRRRSPSLNEAGRSRLSSRKPSVDKSVDDLKFQSQVSTKVNPEDRPIKPMSNPLADSFSGQDIEGSRPGGAVPARRKKEPKQKQVEDKDVSDKVRKQRELMDRRRKYDPRKALQSIVKDEKDQNGAMSVDHKDKNDPRKSLDNIPENLSEDKSAFILPDELGGNISIDHNKPKKEFLKRKTKKVEFKKLDWSNVQRRIDCWVPKENIPEKKEPVKTIQSKPSPRPNRRMTSPQADRDLDMIRLKGEDQKRKDQTKKPKVEKKEKDIMVQIEDTLNSNYLPKLQEVFDKEIVVKESSKIPVLKDTSKFNLYIEENDLKDVLEELEEEYDLLVNL